MKTRRTNWLLILTLALALGVVAQNAFAQVSQDDFIGDLSKWNADPEYQIQGGELANTAVTADKATSRV